MIQGPPPQFDRITVEESDTPKTISYRWHHFTYVMHATDGIIALGYVIAIFSSNWNSSSFWFGFISVSIALILGGLSLYVAMTGVLNETRITFQNQKLYIKGQPIPWFRDRPHEIRNVVKFYNTERKQRWRQEPFRLYPVWALTSDGSVISVLSHVNSAVEAVYICEKLYQWLGLESTPYLDVMLNKLYEPDDKLNPSFTGTRKYSIVPEEIAQAVQLTIEQDQLIYRRTSEDSVIRFDILDVRGGSGEYHTLIQVTIQATLDGSEVMVRLKPKPYLWGSIGHKINIRGFFKKLEFAQESKQYLLNEPSHEQAE